MSISYSFGAYRYPESGTAIADGENFLKKALGAGKKARQIAITVIGKNEKVVIDGNMRTAESSYGTEYGRISEYFYRRVSMYMSPEGIKKCGAIECATVAGENVQFYAEIST